MVAPQGPQQPYPQHNMSHNAVHNGQDDPSGTLFAPSAPAGMPYYPIPSINDLRNLALSDQDGMLLPTGEDDDEDPLLATMHEMEQDTL